jgi:ornithine cyclodeaminase/alanine dehydrogenase-like protein (mu-crystallin family)
VIILDSEEVRQTLPMDQTIAAMKSAFAALSDGRADAPLRSHLKIIPKGADNLFMPAFVQEDGGIDALAIKVVSLFPKNRVLGLPLLHAAVLVMDAETGQMKALMEGGALTAIRTGAGSGAAIDLLARPESRVVAIFGAGAQARTQLEAACTVRKIETVWVYAPSHEHVLSFIDEMAGKSPIPQDLRAASSPEEAAYEADVICAATTSKKPVFSDSYLKPGVHICGVGSYSPEMQEIPVETIARALVVVDSRETALAEAGDLIVPIESGQIAEEQIHAEIGEIILGYKRGRTSSEEITFFKSVGVAVQDAVAAALALRNAEKWGLGQKVRW